MNTYYHKSVEATIIELQADANGLSSQQAEANKLRFGLNTIAEEKKQSRWLVFLLQFNDFLIWILLIAAILSAALGKLESTLVIGVVVLLNAVLGTVQHLKAEQSLAALKKLSSPAARVIRDNEVITIDSKDIVIGDLMLLEAGDFVAADGRIIEAFSLRADESTLTGESVGAEKISDSIKENDLPPGDQKNMIFAGTHITYGRGRAIVTGIGSNTQIGKIARLLEQAKEKQTPLQKNLDDFGKKLAVIIIIISAVIFALNIFRESPILDAIMFSIALAVAAIPEALSSIVTIVLAIGTRKMAQEKAIVRKLHAVEALGSVSVICSDKTGTLTQNKMTVKQVYTNDQIIGADQLDLDQENDAKLLRMALLCNDSITSKREEIGDPTEIALVNWGEVYNYDELEIRKNYQRISELPFDSERKLMSTLNIISGRKVMITKGAVDVVLRQSTYIARNDEVESLTSKKAGEIETANHHFSEKGLRVLAFAYKEYPGQGSAYDINGGHKNSQPNQAGKTDDMINHLALADESDLIFAGLVAMQDPPRPESSQAVADCQNAGIRTIMITGDHIVTASAIAREIGILKQDSLAIEGASIESIDDQELQVLVPKVSVYARVSPEHKIRIVKAWQELGHVVAMTGDGVNDAPALKQSNIGIAMGITGTEVSKDAASIVLADDNFATIVKAVSNGRNIYKNIRNAVKFLLSGNMAGIITVLFASLANLPAPFAPVHLLFINLLTDSLPAIALGIEASDKSVMKDKPRSINEPLLTKDYGLEILIHGLLMATVTIVGFLLGSQTSYPAAMTMSFAVLSLSRLIHGFNCKPKQPLTIRGLLSNRFSWLSFGIGTGLLAAVLFIKPLQNLFETVSLSLTEYLLIAGLSLIPFVCIQLYRRIFHK